MRRYVILSLLLLAPTVALAQPGNFELTPIAAYRFEGDIDLADGELFDPDVELDNGGAFGLAFAIPVSNLIQVELRAMRQNTDLVLTGGLFQEDEVVGDTQVDYYHVGVVVGPSDGNVRPYFTASAGLTSIDIELPNAGSEDRPSLSLGGGVKFFFSDNFGLRLEGRGYYTALDDDDDDHDRWEEEESITQGEASVGLIFAW